jgi:mono/diheme cytochrome c family protein
MRRPSLYALPAVIAALALSACGADLPGGTQDINLPGEDDPEILRGAQLFDRNCAACHTLSAVGAQGSSFRVNDREYKDGPNFNQRDITYDQILYAIRNGGFSSGPMPQNIVVGEDAEAVAKFLAKYAGGDIGRAEDTNAPPAGVSGDSPVEQEETDPEAVPEPDATPPPASRDELDNAQPSP